LQHGVFVAGLFLAGAECIGQSLVSDAVSAGGRTAPSAQWFESTNHAASDKTTTNDRTAIMSKGSRSLPNWQSGDKPLSKDMEMETLEAQFDMTLRQWIERYQHKLVFEQVHYRGIPTWKNVLDLWVYQEIIWETGVEVVIEIGARYGGTTFWLSDLLRNFRGPSATVISIDLERPGRGLPDNVHFICGDSIAPATVAEARAAVAGRRTLVIADGNHAADHVLQEIRLYSPLIPEGCYFIAEDGIVDVMDWKEHTPGPMVAAQQFLSENDEFTLDRAREKFLLTYAPGGFLKRIRPAREVS
jgi:cephalosporin hydroxylase